MAKDNRNSSSSSFYSSNTRGVSNGGNVSNQRSGVKSNTQSTFDIFNINVKDAQKKVTTVFDFTKGKIKENEKLMNKSINKFFNNVDSRIKNSANLFGSSMIKSLDEVKNKMDMYQAEYNKSMLSSTESNIKDLTNKYKSMYSELDKQHEEYTKRVKERESKAGIGSVSSTKPSPSEPASSAVNPSSRSSSSGSPSSFIGGLESYLRSKVNKEFNDNFSQMKSQYDAAVNNGSMTKEQASTLLNDYSKNSQAASKANFKNAAISVGVEVASALKNVLSMFINMFTDGAKEFSSAYESSYNQLATAFSTDQSGVNSMLKDGMSTLDNSMKSVVNYTSDFLPALETVSKQGLIGDNAVAKAISDSIDKKIMPWLDTSSEQWVNMNTYLSQGNLDTLKGQQLMLQKTEAGNRLLQSGVINSMTNDMEPLLRNIDFNTGGAANMTEDAQVLMASMVENGGMTPQEAYEQVKAAMDVEKNQYAALTSGDTNKTLMGIEAINGGSYVDMLQNSTQRIARLGAQTGSDFGVSAVGSNLGLNMPAYTLENASALEYSLSDKTLNNMKKAIESGDKNPEEIYGDALNSAADKVTPTQKALNEIKNSSAETLGLWSTNIPLFWTFAGTVTALLGKIANWGLNELLNKLIFNGGIKNLATSLKNILSKGGSLLPKLKSLFTNGSGSSGIAKVLGSTGAKVAGGIGGAIMTIADGVKGFKKSNEWFGENATTSDKVVSTLGGALGGTGPGIGEKGATFGRVAKNILSNAGKGAAIGTMFGPIGTAVGAGVGAITGAIGGKRIAKAFKKAGQDIKGAVTAWTDPSKSLKDKLIATGKGIATVTTTVMGGPLGLIYKNTIGTAITKHAKNAAKKIGGWFNNVGKSLGSAVKKGAKSVSEMFKKTVVGKAFSEIASTWKDDSKSLGEKITGSVKSLFKNNPLVKAGKAISSSLSKGAKSLKKAVSSAKIGKAATEAANKLRDNIKSAAKKVADTLKDTKLGKAASKAKDKIKGTFDTVKGWFASGSNEIPYDGYVAKLHKGETVYNKHASNIINGVLGINGKSTGLPSTGNLKELLSKTATGKLIEVSKGVFSKMTSLKSDSDDARIISAIESASAKIVKAILEDSSSRKVILDKISGKVGKVKVDYDESIVKLKPVED